MNSFAANPYAAYQNASQTVPKTRQIVMLYEGMVRFLQQAREASMEGRIDERFNKLAKTSDIVVALQGSLDFEEGGEPAQVLYEFYSQIYRQINEAHRAKAEDVSAIDGVINELKVMRDTWDTIDRGDDATKTAQAPSEHAPEVEVPETPAVEAPQPGKVNTSS